ncbi:MAG: hypothetical protein EON87_11760 [Brevundimonas sp.]|nr:MAG: hypothetical protein EON87_11760 [Brevundimonas sp.]
MRLHPETVIQSYRASGAWGSTTIDDLFCANAAARPGAMAIVDAPNRATLDGREPRRLTYADYAAEVDLIARRLLTLGLGKDSIVLIQMPNVVELVALMQACGRIGAILSPTPMQYGAHELRQILNTLEHVACAFTVETFQGKAQGERLSSILGAIAPELPVVSLGHPAPDSGRIDIEGVAPVEPQALAAYRAAHPVDADEIFTICWTSGTTAEPKGVPRSHNNWIWHGRAVVETGNCGPGETLMTPFPAVNMGGFGSALLPWWLTGGKLVLHHPFDLELYASQIESEQVGVVLGAPAILTSLLKAEDILARYDISCLHDAPSGSAPLTPWLITEFERRFGIQIINQFGSNEGTTLVASPADVPDPTERASYFSRIGVPGFRWNLTFAQFVETRLVDPATDETISEPGVPGELLIRSPSIFPGYYRRPDLTADALDERGFFRTGDLFEIACNAAGDAVFYRFMGRAKELIIRGGFNIAPPEIEAVVQGHPAVAEVAVVGYPDDRLGERVCVCAVLQPGASLSLDQVIDLFRQEDVAKFKWPERLELFDSLPRNPIGKVLKRELQRQIDEPARHLGAA